MTTRVLIVDDEESGLERLEGEFTRGMLAHTASLPSPHIELLDTSVFTDSRDIIAAVRDRAAQRWDAIIVDVWLTEHDTEELPLVLLPIEIISAFRELNKIAIGCIYSGNIRDYLARLLGLEKTSGTKRPVEQVLRTIIESGISEFLSRKDVASWTINRLLNMPWPLRVEREVLKMPKVQIESALLPADVRADLPKVMSLGAVADNLRIRDRVGDAVLSLIVQHGVAAISQIYQLPENRNVPLLCITADCHDLKFLEDAIHSLGEAMPRMETVIFASSDRISDAVSFSISKAVDVPVIIIMVHGGDGYLKGADPTSTANAPEAPKWMDVAEHYALFSEKVIYCFSCNSITLAKRAIGAGAKAFIGFPDIPFYRFKDDEPIDEPELTSALQSLFGELTQAVLLRWFLGRDTVEQLVDVIRMTVRSLAQRWVAEHPDHLYRNTVVEMFDRIALGVDFEGDGTWIFPGT